MSAPLNMAQPHDLRANVVQLPQAPYRYLGGSLGLCDDFPVVRFAASGGGRFESDASEILRHLDLFAEPDLSRILFDIGMQCGLDPSLLPDRNQKPAGAL